jgi:hypothetical protein
MGTTLTALNNGSIAYKYVLAFEGYKYLLTNGSAAAAVTAWAGTDWSLGLSGLFVKHDHQAGAVPWEPFQGGGSLQLAIAADPNATTPDQFGVDTHSKLSGAETYLNATADRDDTTITVKSTSGFAASGEAFVGTECFAYTGVTATTFTTCTRGRYSPLDRGAGARWGEHHRQGLASNSVTLAPIVSAQPRTWIGKLVGLWVHREVSGVLDVKAQAQLVFFGRILEVSDDPDTGATIVKCEQVMDAIANAVIGKQLYAATIPEGVYIAADADPTNFPSFDFGDQQDFGGGGAVKTANPLSVVASGAAGTNQINAGYYTLAQICTFMNAWLAAELAATRIYGTYALESPVPIPDGGPLRSNILYYVPGVAGKRSWWLMRVPVGVGTLLGFEDALSSYNGRVSITPAVLQQVNGFQNWAGTQTPLTTLAFVTASLGIPNRLQLVNETGTFTDQYALLPAASKPPQQLGLQWGVFLIDEKYLVIAAHNGTDLTNMINAYGINWPNKQEIGVDFPISRSADASAGAGPIPVRQIIFLAETFSNLIKYLFWGTGTTGYNDATYDVLGFGLGLGIPGTLLGSTFNSSIDGLPGATDPMLLIIDKPIKLAELLGIDLTLRWAFPRWKAGGLSFSAWQTPVSTSSSPLLSESNKAAPGGDQTGHRSATKLTDEWQRDLVKIQYNRDVTRPTDDSAYSSILTLENRTSVDDSGGEGHPLTLKARNMFGAANNAGMGVEDLAPNFLVTWSMFSQPVRIMTRSIGPAYYEQLAPGDMVLVTDTFARDPNTGRRGISARPALVVRVRYNRGGATQDNPDGTKAQGEVDLLFAPDGTRIAAYAYGARVDETVSTGGFTNGYDSVNFKLRCKAHEYSESSEAADASRFVATDKILIIEIDPATSSAPTSWQRTIASVTGNDITLTAALSAPAFDTTKKYRITYDHFAVATATEQVLAFQADDVDALIENLAPADQFGAFAELLIFTAYDATILPELVPDACWGDGKAYDVGHESALIQTLNNLCDYRQARENAVVYLTPIGNTAGTGTYQLLDFYPIHLSNEITPSGISRLLTVAPLLRSTTGSASIRVTLSRTPPRLDTLQDHPRPSFYVEAVFTSASATYALAASQTLDTRVKEPFTGAAWIWIEGTLHAETRGLARCTEGPRQ